MILLAQNVHDALRRKTDRFESSDLMRATRLMPGYAAHRAALERRCSEGDRVDDRSAVVEGIEGAASVSPE